MLVGGGMNMEPPDFALTGFDAQLDATVMTPGTHRGTYRAANASSLLDYFVVTNRAAAAVQSAGAVEASGAKGHVPVRLSFKPCVTTLRALYLRKPPALSTSRVYGPIVAPPCWTKAREAALTALGAAREGRTDTQSCLDDAYRAWADLAEIEVSNYTGQQLKKYGERGRMPNFVWRSVVPEATPAAEEPYAAAAAWLGGVIKELTRCGRAVMDNPEDRGADADDLQDDPAHIGDGTIDDRHVETEIRAARARRPPLTRRGCARVIREINGSLVTDFPDCCSGAVGGEMRTLHGKLVACAARLYDAAAHGDSWDRGAENRDRAALLNDAVTELEVLANEAGDIEARFTAQANSEANRRWKEWVSEGVERGAARAHAYVRGPKAWTPTVTTLPDGSETGALDDLIDGQRTKYSRMWRPAHFITSGKSVTHCRG